MVIKKVIIVLLSLMLVGCSTVNRDVEKAEKVYERYKEVDPDVSIKDVDIPTIGNVCFTLNNGDLWLDVTYGLGTDFLWVESGLPGFGYEMVVESPLEFCTDDVFVKCDYGDYTYVYEGSIFVEKAGSSLISDGKAITNFGELNELLFLLCTTNNKAMIYKLSNGPIVG